MRREAPLLKSRAIASLRRAARAFKCLEDGRRFRTVVLRVVNPPTRGASAIVGMKGSAACKAITAYGARLR